jgi:hypothetical protein
VVTGRRARLSWWLPSKSWRNDGWRWRVAALADKLRGQCWASLVGWVQRDHEEDPETPLGDLTRRLPSRPMDDVCRSDRDRNGTCYFGKLRTAEADAQMRARGAGRGVVR